MRLSRFYVPHKLGVMDSMPITHAPLVNQLKNVFRLKSGDQVILFDNSGHDFVATIAGYEKDTVTFSVSETFENKVTPTRETFLFASVVKKDNFEWITQKATELGVSHIVPIMSERSEKKNLNMDRLIKILIEASEQSGRGVLPTLSEIINLEDALEKYSEIKSVAWHPQSPKFVSQDLIDVTGTYIGPEGGWSENEIKLFEASEVKTLSLGPQVLRAETAVIAAVSQIVF